MNQILTYHTATLVPTAELKAVESKSNGGEKVAVTSLERKTKMML